MPGCSGIMIVTGMGQYGKEGDAITYTYNKQEVKEFLKTAIKTFPSKTLVCILTKEQKKAVGRAVKKSGFKKGFSFFHNPINSKVYEYIKLPKKTKKNEPIIAD